MAIKIRNTQIEYPVFLAPMAGVSDYAFRKLCYLHGASLAVTEMVSAKAIYYNDLKTARLAYIHDDECLTAVQIFGSEPEIMAYAASRLESNSYKGCVSRVRPSMIDINMGCPVKKVVSNKEGSYLMKDPSRIYDIVKAVRSAVSIPVTVKMRAGWDENSLNAPECAIAAQEGGADLICIHGRTREQMYLPPVNLDIIGKVKRAVSIPVIGNGGINTPEDAMHMMQVTGCDGVALARGARGNPHLFSQIISLMKGEDYSAPSNSQLLELSELHLSLLLEDKGEEVAVREARSHLIWYARGFRGAGEFRSRVNCAQSSQELFSLINDLKNTVQG